MKNTVTDTDYSEIPDDSLWERFKEGDNQALSVIFLKNYDPLHNYVSRMVSGNEEARDLIQDLFLKLWNSRSKLGKCDSIKYYLFQSARRLIIDQFYKRKKPLNTEINEQHLPSEPSFESVLIFNQQQAQLRKGLKKAMSLLSKRQQEAIYLRYYQQIDYPAIAEIMSVNIQSVRNLVHSAIQELKQHIDNVILLFLSFFRKK